MIFVSMIEKKDMDWPASLDEYQKLVIRMNTPRVVIDNAACATATLVKVDSARKDGILLEAVQVLTDLDLSIKKAYISSDGRWFMDVFHVTDRYGEKLADEAVFSDIERSLGASDEAAVVSVGMDPLTTLELTGADRPGLLSEVFAVLSDLHCIVAEAKLWTHNGRIAALIFVKEEDSGLRIEDSEKIRRIEALLRNVVRGATTAVSSSAINPSSGGTYVDRRLHQMMFADRDYERGNSGVSKTSVSVQNWTERGYSIVNVQCRDRPKLLFDVICTLTDMGYVVFHGTINTTGDRACQEFCIRHSDGSPINSEAERQRVIQCLQAAIDRRASEGLRLELYATNDRSGLLAEATRTFRENGLSVTRAEVSTKGDMALNMFYVTDAAGHPTDQKTIDAVIQRVGAGRLKVYDGRSNQAKHMQPKSTQEESSIASAGLLYLGSLVRKNLYNLGLIRSCS